MQNKKTLIIIGVFIGLVAGGILFFTLGGGISPVEDITHDPRRPQAVQLGGTYVFYDDAELVREDFTIQRILGQTQGGYLAVLFERERGISIGLHRIVLVSECLTRYEDFFAATPEWEAFFFAAADDYGRLYVLGTDVAEYNRPMARIDLPDDLYLFVYNAVGEQLERTRWEALPDFYQLPGRLMATYLSGDYFVSTRNTHATRPDDWAGHEFLFHTKTGEELYRYTPGQFEMERFAHGTVGSGYFYGLFLHDFYRDDDDNLFLHKNRLYTVRKIEIPTGRVVWEKYWYEETGSIEHILFCGYRGLLYLFQTTRLFVYDDNTGELYFLRDLTNAGIRVMQRMSIARINSVSMLSDGRLHFVYSYTDSAGEFGGRFAGYMEWVFTPLYGEAALARVQELEARFAETPVIRFFDLRDDSLDSFGMQANLIVFAAERDALAHIDFLVSDTGGLGRFDEYSEALNAALFAGTADWDIVVIPSTFNITNDFALCTFVERGMLLDLLPFAHRRFIENNERYYTNLFEALLHDGGLYHLPRLVSVPFVGVPNDHPELDYLTARSESWTWAEFLQIVQRLEAETGQPQISSNNDFMLGHSNMLPSFLPNPITNVPPFFVFDEELLLAMGHGERLSDFSETLGLFSALAAPRYNRATGAGTFTFACMRAMSLLRDRYTILPMPTMRGEYIFYSLGDSLAVLTTGTSSELAAEFVLNWFEFKSGTCICCRDSLFNFTRPRLAAIINNASVESFAQYEVAVYRANTYLRLPASVRLAINEAVLQYVHGALSRDAAVQRVADIMWIFVNE